MSIRLSIRTEQVGSQRKTFSLKKKINVRQISPYNRPRRPTGGADVQLYSFPLNSALHTSGLSTPRRGRFTFGKENWYPLYRRLGGLQDQSVQLRKVSPPPGFDPRTVQPVASRYTSPLKKRHRVIYYYTLTHASFRSNTTHFTL